MFPSKSRRCRTMIKFSMTVSYCIEGESSYRAQMLTSLPAESTGTYTGKTLDLQVMQEPTVRTLGMGAGGKIIQNIEPDHNDPRMWDVANSKLLNIHLVDSRTFKLVSNMDPPQKPITPEQYHEMGFPFYQLQPEKIKKTEVPDQKNRLVTQSIQFN